jgi:hypothetical protein
MITEKRRYLRFQAKDDAYAIFGCTTSTVGKLKDISIGGLAFIHFEQIEDVVQEFSKVTIFASDHRNYLPDLTCRLIYDFTIDENNNIQNFQEAFRKKRCGVQFTSTTETQIEKLKLFIDHHTRRLQLS